MSACQHGTAWARRGRRTSGRRKREKREAKMRTNRRRKADSSPRAGHRTSRDITGRRVRMSPGRTPHESPALVEERKEVHKTSVSARADVPLDCPDEEKETYDAGERNRKGKRRSRSLNERKPFLRCEEEKSRRTGPARLVSFLRR
jgi:hypothetical protein